MQQFKQNVVVKLRDQSNISILMSLTSVGYRVKSRRGTHFRRWATKILREHLVKWYTLNQKRLAEQT
ncbi:MAG: virulence RhuM family protein [Deltaproteobacteria bacterium]|nr:virulence RhuM family protein [Deltaproteobacteria bacterium]MCW9049157.1 virulence RhuM family protein [Deltaproteobacteria bacterium]